MSTYTITVTDEGDVAAVADGGTATIVVSDGASSGGGAVESVNGHVGVVVLAASDVGADASGAAATAQTAAEAYTDTQVAAEVTRADAAYDAIGAAAAAQTASEAYTDAAVAGAGGGGTVDSVVQGSGISVDSTDPANPIVSSPLAASATQPGDLGDSASRDVGTSAGTVAAGDDSRITGAAQKSANLGDLASSSSARTNLGLGTSAVLDVPASGDAGVGQVVKGTDSRLTDARTPTTHTHVESDVTGLTTDLAAKLAKASNLSDVASASTARTNLGLGTAAVANKVAAGSTGVLDATDASTTNARTPTTHASSHASGGSDAVALDASQVTRTTNAQTGTTYTLVLADASKFITLSNASAITLTVPPNSSVAFLVGTEIILAQLGAGQVTIAAGAGVTLNSTPGLKIAAQYGTAALKKTATDTWLVFGRLSA